MPNATVLVVDDEPLIRWALVNRLKQEGYRTLEEKSFKRVGGATDVTVDVRVIAATNRSLQDEVRKGHFREDLFYRLNVMPVPLPPLRDRRDDVAALLNHYVDGFNTEFRKKVQGVTPGALAALKNYTWPGNVRELRNAVERAMLLTEGSELGEEHFPMLKSPDGQLSAGATLLGLNRDQIRYRIEKFKLEKPD